jgi:predicted Zn-dependent protease
LLGYGIKLLLGGLLLCVRQPKHPSMRFLFFWLKQRQMIASLQRSERLEAHVKWIAILIATCMIPVPLRPQERSPATKTRANSQASSAVILGERLAREYEKQVGFGSTPELDGISRYVSSVGSQVASVLPSHLQYHFVFDPNPDFKSAFALPGGYIIVGGGLLAIAQTEDELANVLAHEIEHVELGQVSRRVSELGKQKEIKNLELSEFLPGYTKEEELACDLNGQQLAAKAGYSPAGMLTLLETFKALRKGESEEPSEKHPSLAERIAQAEPLAQASPQNQRPLRIP